MGHVPHQDGGGRTGSSPAGPPAAPPDRRSPPPRPVRRPGARRAATSGIRGRWCRGRRGGCRPRRWSRRSAGSWPVVTSSRDGLRWPPSRAGIRGRVHRPVWRRRSRSGGYRRAPSVGVQHDPHPVSPAHHDPSGGQDIGQASVAVLERHEEQGRPDQTELLLDRQGPALGQEATHRLAAERRALVGVVEERRG